MIKEKLGWDKRIKNISIFLELFLIILLILCIITKQDSEVLVVMSTLCLLEMPLVMYLNFYTIHVYEDYIIIKSLFSSISISFFLFSHHSIKLVQAIVNVSCNIAYPAFQIP